MVAGGDGAGSWRAGWLLALVPAAVARCDGMPRNVPLFPTRVSLLLDDGSNAIPFPFNPLPPSDLPLSRCCALLLLILDLEERSGGGMPGQVQILALRHLAPLRRLE